jgi:hypothetical protein
MATIEYSRHRDVIHKVYPAIWTPDQILLQRPDGEADARVEGRVGVVACPSVPGGRVAAATGVPLATIRQTAYAQSLPFATRRLEIIGAELGADGGVIGVATMAVDQLLSPGRLSEWIPAGSPAGAAIAPCPGDPARLAGRSSDARRESGLARA